VVENGLREIRRSRRARHPAICPDRRNVVWAGRNLGDATQSEIRHLRKEFQIVFQDPLASLDPRMTTARALPNRCGRLKPQFGPRRVDERVRSIMDKVGLDPIG